jgi:hypothetical protein
MRQITAICANSRPSRGFVLLAGAEPAIRVADLLAPRHFP